MTYIESVKPEQYNWSPLERELYELLMKNGPMSRAAILAVIDYPRTTVYDNLMRLKNRGYMKKFSRPTNARGRPTVFFKALE